MEIYKHVLNMLDSLFMEENQNQTTTNVSYDNQYTTNHSILLGGLDQTQLGSAVSYFIIFFSTEFIEYPVFRYNKLSMKFWTVLMKLCILLYMNGWFLKI